MWNVFCNTLGRSNPPDCMLQQFQEFLTDVLYDARACELLQFSFRKAKQGQSFPGTGGEMASSRSDLGGAKAMDQGDGEIAQGGHNLWSIAGAQAGAVFPRSVTSRT